MRSDTVKKGYDKAPHRSLFRAVGLKDADFDKPFIGVANSYVGIIPGHVHLQEVGRIVREAIAEAGGVPFEFNTIGVDDGIAMGHTGMNYSLPSRELIADSIETMAHGPLLRRAGDDRQLRQDRPGDADGRHAGQHPGDLCQRRADGGGQDERREGRGSGDGLRGRRARIRRASIDDAALLELEKTGCPTCGSCSGMFTANSMNCLAEALGMALPGNGTILAVDEKRKALYRAAGRQILTLVAQDLKPRDIVTRETIDNAFCLDMAMGGSTNTVLHTLAIAHEAGIAYSLDRINQLSRSRPVSLQGEPGRAPPRGRRGPGRRDQRHPEPAGREGRRPPARSADGERQDARRGDPGRQGDGRRRHPSAGQSLPRHRRPDGAVRQSRPRGRGGQDRRRCAGDAPSRGSSGDLRVAGRRPGGHPERQGEGRATWS